ncbi:MAG: 4-hydroxy-tetrahydrodipicolinate reductase [Elusimicrobia bacterium]|nr:4-hydroxy-tetrahydrodipicolinate reductase [Elusimicrobiota bacterium]
MSEPIRIVLCGANGRMGRAVAAAVEKDGRFSIAAGVDRSGAFASPERLPELLKTADVLVDFSSAGPALSFIEAAAAAGVPAVSGTTGFDESRRKCLETLSGRIPLLVAANMSLGMNLLYHLAARAAAALPSYDAAVSETHHALKKDSPSGSALRLIDAVKAARRDGRPVGAASLRVGDVVGDHTLVLAGPGERIELTHRAQSREVFARGALEAALWIRGRKAGLYSMADVLDIPAA